MLTGPLVLLLYFLGLTKDEIDMAISRSGIAQTETLGPALGPQGAARDPQGAPQNMVPYQTVGPPLPARIEGISRKPWENGLSSSTFICTKLVCLY